MIDFDTFTKLPKNVGDLDKLIVAKGFKNLPKVQSIAQSGHNDDDDDADAACFSLFRWLGFCQTAIPPSLKKTARREIGRIPIHSHSSKAINLKNFTFLD